MEHPSVIEFLGIAGSGKTCRAEGLVRAWRDRDIATWYRREQPRFSHSWLGEALAHPARTTGWWLSRERRAVRAAWLGLMPGNGMPPTPDWWFRMDLWWHHVARLDPRVRRIVFDEGGLQHAVSACTDTGFTASTLRTFVEMYCRHVRLAKVILVEPSVSVCAERLALRDRIPVRLQGLAPQDLRARLEQDARCVRQVATALVDLGVPCAHLPGLDLEEDVAGLRRDGGEGVKPA